MFDNKTIDLRLAEPRDSLLLAEAAVAAGGGLYEHLLAEAAAGVSIQSAVAAALSASADGLSWRNAIVADSGDGDMALGAAVAYPGADFRLAPTIAAAAGAAALNDLAPLFAARPPDDSYYLHAIWTRAEGRGMGVGGLMLDAVMAIARDQGFGQVSLHLWRDNAAALGLYESRGFETIAEIPIERRPRLPHVGGKLLMAARV